MENMLAWSVPGPGEARGENLNYGCLEGKHLNVTLNPLLNSQEEINCVTDSIIATLQGRHRCQAGTLLPSSPPLLLPSHALALWLTLGLESKLWC